MSITVEMPLCAQDGRLRGGAVLEARAQHVQKLRRVGQEGVLQRHKVPQDHQGLHDTRWDRLT